MVSDVIGVFWSNSSDTKVLHPVVSHGQNAMEAHGIFLLTLAAKSG